jgi:hypothetical protein
VNPLDHVSGWALFAAAMVVICFLPALVIGLAALAAAGDADTAAGRDEVGERA